MLGAPSPPPPPPLQFNIFVGIMATMLFTLQYMIQETGLKPRFPYGLSTQIFDILGTRITFSISWIVSQFLRDPTFSKSCI